MISRSFNWRPYPFIRLLLALILGIVLESQYSITIDNWVLSSIFFYCLLFLWLSLNRKLSILGNQLTGVLTLFLFVFLGVLSLKFHDPRISSNYYGNFINGEYQEISFRVDDFHIKDNWIKVIGEVKEIKSKSGDMLPVEGKLLLYLEPVEQVPGFGQILNLSVKINPIPGPKNPNAFDYKTYQANNGIYFQSFCRGAYWKLTEQHETTIQILANHFRYKLVELLKSSLGNGQEYAVGSALVLGYRDDVSEELNNAYIQTGSIHILAVSGLHVGIVSGVLSLFLGLIKRNSLKIRLLKLIIILVFLWGFVFVTGAGGSIIRAAVMFSILHTGAMLAKQKYIYNTLAASAFVILLWNPNMLFDVGFLLSYAAVIGIIVIQPLLLKLWSPENKILKLIWELSTITLAAQILTLPLVLYYFNQTSIYFLISGIIVVPISTIAMYAGIALFLSNVIFPVLTGFIANIMYSCLYLMNSIIYGIQKLPGNLTDNISFTVFEAVLMLIAICFILYSFIYRNKSSFKYSLISIMILLMLRTYFIISASHQKQIVFYSSPKTILVDYYLGRTCLKLYSEINNKEEKYVARNNRIAHRINNVVSTSLDGYISVDELTYKDFEFTTKEERVFFLSKKSEAFYGNSKAENVYVLDYETPEKLILNKMTKRILINPLMQVNALKNWKQWSMGKMYKFIDLREKAFVINYQ